MSGNVSELEINGRKIYILGTAHVSKDSAEEAAGLIETLKPDSVCIELDDERMANIKNPNAWNDSTIANVIKQKKAAYLLVNLILSSYQKRLAENFGVNAGEEMIRSINAAEKIGANVYPVDRNIKTTFLRLWRKMGFIKKIKLLFNLIFSFVDDSDSELTENDLEQLKTQDMLEAALGELGDEYPEVKRYLVDERDIYLSQKIKNAPGNTVVAIVGAAHKSGVINNIKKDIPLEDINTVPKKSPIGKIIGWAIPIAIIIMVALTFTRDAAMGFEQIKRWILYNGTLSAVGTIIAGGSIWSVLTAFVAAPITSLNPLLAAGWFAGLTEAKIRKPTVADINALSNDLSSFKGLRRNKTTKILLVVILANLGSAIGSYISGIGILKIFNDIFFK